MLKLSPSLEDTLVLLSSHSSMSTRWTLLAHCPLWYASLALSMRGPRISRASAVHNRSHRYLHRMSPWRPFRHGLHGEWCWYLGRSQDRSCHHGRRTCVLHLHLLRPYLRLSSTMSPRLYACDCRISDDQSRGRYQLGMHRWCHSGVPDHFNHVTAHGLIAGIVSYMMINTTEWH
ncbi:uncharacterized protein BDZ99DRAFT_264272 [Mytilinidion resinicola]|uniref:Uncharacterized protein n=1 Tax=Mytilinidion resinicola TaxID=574789 RepID=A0A6A6YWC4_9PEZI|nr:uncharacterized protein BDZ99DRAFT_264272 [Mytilinidion resinicola]KAF2812294.1 hypothetical protein BDZ99DRAFT_264272 [Mytilinidion resinicola]